MKAIAVRPGQPKSIHQVDIPDPRHGAGLKPRDVLVKVLQIGVDGTDKEIFMAEYGRSPQDADFLVAGHEAFGRVEAVGSGVWELAPGDYVVPTVRRAGHSIYDAIGLSDMTTDSTYFERGINLLHGFMTEYFVDDADFIVKIPPGLKDVGVLLEPLTIALKGVTQAYEIQRRLHLWRPRRAAVLGAGPLGLLATLALRLRGLEVTTFGLNQRPFLNAEYVDRLGAHYQVSTERSLLQVAQEDGGFDILFEATGFSPLVFDAMQATAKDGVCILASITGGKRTCEVPADKINLEFVLGNKVMVGTVNANREYFEMGVKDMALAQVSFPGWLESFLTHPVDGLDSYEELYHNLLQPSGVIKTYMKVAPH